MRVVKETTSSTTNNKDTKSHRPKQVTSSRQRTATPHNRAAEKGSTTVLQKRSHTPSSVENTVMGVTLDVDKLKAIVKGYGEYPSKYRYVCILSVL